MSRLPSLLLPLLLVTSVVQAQDATVFGTVNEIVGDEYHPIPFAKVSLSNGEHSIHPVVPDIEGKFTLESVPAGVYWMRVTAIGFDTLSEELALAAGDSLRVRIRLGDKSIAGILIEPEDTVSAGQRLGGSGQ
ncbi:MAG: carboxypeptidase-like regulatory domain-containing protein [Rhodothermales bacterium]|nr:carboxypeptidase-like regulatory domain-containing protein [Rhodothermales bacterium]